MSSDKEIANVLANTGKSVSHHAATNTVDTAINGMSPDAQLASRHRSAK